MVAETILSRQEVEDASIADVYALFLAEKALSDGNAPDVPLLEIDSEETLAEESLEICGIKSVRGVNALAEGQDLEFHSDLTILFGQNGSGKTGYARILKRIPAQFSTLITPQSFRRGSISRRHCGVSTQSASTA